MEPAFTKNSTLLQCLESSVPSEKSSTLLPVPESSIHNAERKVTMANEKVMLNMKSELHAHRIQSGIHARNLNKQDGHINVQQSKQQNTEDRYHLHGNQYTEITKRKPVYRRGGKDRYRKMWHYSNSIKHEFSNKSEKFNPILQFQNSILPHDNSMTKDRTETEDRKKFRYEGTRLEQTETKFQEKVKYIQNDTAKTLTRNDQKYMKNVMTPDYQHAWEIQHNNTFEGPNNTGQHSALQNSSEGVELKSGPRSKQALALTNCNFRYSSTVHFGQGLLTTVIREYL
jgi:hypothetical protein